MNTVLAELLTAAQADALLWLAWSMYRRPRLAYREWARA